MRRSQCKGLIAVRRLLWTRDAFLRDSRLWKKWYAVKQRLTYALSFPSQIILWITNLQIQKTNKNYRHQSTGRDWCDPIKCWLVSHLKLPERYLVCFGENYRVPWSITFHSRLPVRLGNRISPETKLTIKLVVTMAIFIPLNPPDPGFWHSVGSSIDERQTRSVGGPIKDEKSYDLTGIARHFEQYIVSVIFNLGKD